MGVYYRTWIRLSQWFKKSATSAPSDAQQDSPCLSRINCTELNNLHHHCGNAVMGIRLERKLAMEALRAGIGKIPTALSHLKYMDQHLARVERALATRHDTDEEGSCK